MFSLEVTPDQLRGARRAIRQIGGHIVSSSPAGRGYVLHYVMVGGAR